MFAAIAVRHKPIARFIPDCWTEFMQQYTMDQSKPKNKKKTAGKKSNQTEIE